MQSVCILSGFECLKALEQRKRPEEEHVVNHEAEERFELEVRRAHWCEPDHFLYLLNSAILAHEIHPRGGLRDQLVI